MSDKYSIYWGDTHHNTYMHYIQDPSLEDVIGFASTYLDFYTGAYYTPIFRNIPVLDQYSGMVEEMKDGHLSEKNDFGNWRGVNLEGTKDPEKMALEWNEFQEVTAKFNRPGEFVAFPGYEWQGNGRWGDHNVVYLSEGYNICMKETIAELYEFLKSKDAIAIPHHTGYQVGLRAPVWSACNENISPFAEIYSVHGSSETDEEWVGLRHNAHMGPGFSGGTYQDALNQELHIGAICSTDNWTNMPAKWNSGFAACLAKDLSRESLWDAFKARRVYGVTGDRIKLDYTLNDHDMGSIIDFTPEREIKVKVIGSDAIDRIEILRNGQVIATHCHQGTWTIPDPGTKSKYKMRIEIGWGSRPGEIPMPDQEWTGNISLIDGQFINWEPCWISRGHKVPLLDGSNARFEMLTSQEFVSSPYQNATVFEFNSYGKAELSMRLNSLEFTDNIHNMAEKNRLLWYKDECIKLVEKTTGIKPDVPNRDDVYYHHANKAKIHKLIPETGYTATFAITDDEPLTGETNYRVRIEQRNGQRAWSSPIWVKQK